jgi:DNA-binding beta-propeller fold protein YncE
MIFEARFRPIVARNVRGGNMKRIFWIFLSITAFLCLAPWMHAQQNLAALETGPLELTAQIPLPGVRGRFDHFTFDPAEPGRVFISALGNNSVEVLNLVEGVEIQHLPGIPDPQGIVYAIGVNKLFVGSRQGKLYIYDGITYELQTVIDYKADVDNLRYDAAAKRVYLGYGDGDTAAIGMVDATTNQRLDEAYKIGAHPESYQLERSGPNVYANVPDLKQVAVIDRTTKKITKWPIPENNDANFPMALDEADHRLFIATRTPPRLMVFDTTSGKVVATLPCVGDVDDLYYDANHKRVYIPGGQGFIDVFQQKNPDHYELTSRVPTVVGARTAGYAARLGKKGTDRFFLAVPIAPGREASVWVYTVQE